ncbi:MAG: preprotein translocase subunit SecG [Patescibacteria group bacterium]|jgi:preprotein translocase subunit SecG
MNYLLTLLQIIVSIILSAVILLQAKGSGLSSTFGGSGAFHHTRRGFERILFQATILLAAVFVATSLANIFLG